MEGIGQRTVWNGDMLVVIGEQHRVDDSDIVNRPRLAARLDIIPHLKRFEQQDQQLRRESSGKRSAAAPDRRRRRR